MYEVIPMVSFSEFNDSALIHLSKTQNASEKAILPMLEGRNGCLSQRNGHLLRVAIFTTINQITKVV
jgi:hypothetical protein